MGDGYLGAGVVSRGSSAFSVQWVYVGNVVAVDFVFGGREGFDGRFYFRGFALF